MMTKRTAIVGIVAFALGILVGHAITSVTMLPGGWKQWVAHAVPTSEPISELRPIPLSELKDAKARIPEWEKYAVAQRRLATGCIPTGYEYLLRSAGVPGVEFNEFQEDFDLGPALNNFHTVADAVRKKYPDVRFGIKRFDKADEKIKFIEKRLDEGQPILISLGVSPHAWHIMPVLGYNDTELFLLYMVSADGFKNICSITKREVMRRHYEWDGRDVAHLEKNPPRE